MDDDARNKQDHAYTLRWIAGEIVVEDCGDSGKRRRFALAIAEAANELERQAAENAALKAERTWIDVRDRLPELKAKANGHLQSVSVLCAFEGGRVRGMRYAVNNYASTTRGRLPRWEESHGRLAWGEPTHWMPMPDGPITKGSEND